MTEVKPEGTKLVGGPEQPGKNATNTPTTSNTNEAQGTSEEPKSLSNKELKALQKAEKAAKRAQAKQEKQEPNASPGASMSAVSSNIPSQQQQQQNKQKQQQGSSKDAKATNNKQDVKSAEPPAKPETPPKMIPFFAHLVQERGPIHINKISPLIHPAFVRLSLKMQNLEIMGSTARLFYMLIALKEVIWSLCSSYTNIKC